MVSGLARGVDAAAHRGALSVGGLTIAVQGCGLEHTYPPEHRTLRQEIEVKGAALSELPLGAPPLSYHFPRRNRIISGLSLGVVVTEAAEDSGALITARLALEQGREVFAVPGFIKAIQSRGPNALIKQGAKLVERVEDIVDELRLQISAVRHGSTSTLPVDPPLEGHERRLWECLSTDPTPIDDLIERSGLPPPEVTALLTLLELQGVVRQVPGSSWVRI